MDSRMQGRYPSLRLREWQSSVMTDTQSSLKMDVCCPPPRSFLQLGTSLPGVRSLIVSGCTHGDGSSYHPLTDESMEQLGLGRHLPESGMTHHWDYVSLANPPAVPGETPLAASIYRGLVPAKNILNRDFAVNGAMVCDLPSLPRRIPPPNNSRSHSFQHITRTCVKLLPIGSPRTSDVTHCDSRRAWTRHAR